MDDFKPEDDMKADRNDRRAGRSRQSSERDADPQINFDDVDLDADEGRPTRAGKARREREEEEFEEELDAQDEEMLEEQPVERRPRKRKKSAGQTGLPPVHHDGCGDSGAAAVDRGYRFRTEIAIIFQPADRFRREEH